TGGSSRRVLSLDGKKGNGSVGAGRGLPATSSSAWNDGRLGTTLSVTAPKGSVSDYPEAGHNHRRGRPARETTVAGRPNARRSVYDKKSEAPRSATALAMAKRSGPII